VINSDDLVVTGNIEVLDDIYVLGSSGTDFDAIFFDVYEGPYLAWDDIDNQFEFNGGSGLALTGVIQAGNQFANVAYNRMGTLTTSQPGDINANDDLLISGSLEVIGPSHYENGLTLSTGDLFVAEGTFTATSGAILSGGLNFGTPNLLTISVGGAVTPIGAYHTIAAEGVTIADDLITIIGGIAGDIIIIRADAGDTITVDTLGNIRLESGNLLVMSGDDLAAFIFDGTTWLELLRLMQVHYPH